MSSRWSNDLSEQSMTEETASRPANGKVSATNAQGIFSANNVLCIPEQQSEFVSSCWNCLKNQEADTSSDRCNPYQIGVFRFDRTFSIEKKCRHMSSLSSPISDRQHVYYYCAVQWGRMKTGPTNNANRFEIA